MYRLTWCLQPNQEKQFATVIAAFYRFVSTLEFDFSPDCNSLMVEQQAKACFQRESMWKLSQIREIYIKARYSRHPVSDNDAQQMKELYQQLKSEESSSDQE